MLLVKRKTFQRSMLNVLMLLAATLFLDGLGALGADPSLLSAREGFVQVEGGPVWYRIFGGGKETPLLMVHGGPGGRSCTFEPVAEMLSQERPVILYDHESTRRQPRLLTAVSSTIDPNRPSRFPAVSLKGTMRSTNRCGDRQSSTPQELCAPLTSPPFCLGSRCRF